MAPSWDPKLVLDLDLNSGSFTCVGTTRRGARCGNAMISAEYRRKAQRIIDRLPELRQCRRDSEPLLDTLEDLAWLTLCPRWHQSKLPQADIVAEKWLRMILDLEARTRQRITPTINSRNPTNSSRVTVHPTIGSSNTLSGIFGTERSTQRSNASRTVTTTAVQARSNPSTHPVAERGVSSTSTPQIRQTPASRVTQVQSLPVVYTTTNTEASRRTQSSVSNSDAAIGSRSRAREIPSLPPTVEVTRLDNEIATAVASEPATPTAPLTRPVEPASTASRNDTASPIAPLPAVQVSLNISITSSPNTIEASQAQNNTILINTQTANFDELVRAVEGIFSQLTNQGRVGSSLALSPLTQSSSSTRSVDVPRIEPFEHALFSPVPRPIPSHPSGPLSISSVSELELSTRATNTPSSSGTSTPVLVSRPASPAVEPSPAVNNDADPSHRVVARRPLGDCYICSDPIMSLEESVWCRGSCGNNVHRECFEAWDIVRLNDGRPSQCGYCRAPWVHD